MSRAGAGAAGTLEWHVRMGEGDAGACCAVVATAEYCTGVVAALASNVAKLLDPPLGEQVRGREVLHDPHPATSIS